MIWVNIPGIDMPLNKADIQEIVMNFATDVYENTSDALSGVIQKVLDDD